VTSDVAVVGAGPAGLCAAIAAAERGARVAVFDRDGPPGGQLIKQTHRFFGSAREQAGTRGIDIARQLGARLGALPAATLFSDTTVLGFYPDRVLLAERDDEIIKCRAERFIFAAGAAERPLAFPGNDLPGIYGAGAVQTLMNVHGVRPGRRVLMVGSGNIGLIVSYQLLQAGVAVTAVVEALPRIGGYLVHAAKIRRAGVPILAAHTVLEAHGTDCLEAATIGCVKDFVPVPGTGRRVECDVMCLAVGLSPLGDLMWEAGCRMVFCPELGGHVAWRDADMQTSVPGVYVAGDAAGIEEASSAMAEGRLAGLASAASLGLIPGDEYRRCRAEVLAELDRLRGGPTAQKVREGLARLSSGPAGGGVSADMDAQVISTQLLETGAPAPEDVARATPPPERLARGPVAVVECFQRIPCDPCAAACKHGAIAPFADINDLPRIDHDACDGCGACISRCPGLAIVVVDESRPDAAVVRLPCEFLPLPRPGDEVSALDREGRPVAAGRVVRVQSGRALDRTAVVWLEVPRGMGMVVRHFIAGAGPAGGPAHE
jgi:NADPH-dependent 2,4-dienoyl-CoA reductase/sulfur reductase-like enzyme/Pyruvate/2-oxoacid:ferredoxin oxidoreductase delta subunit